MEPHLESPVLQDRSDPQAPLACVHHAFDRDGLLLLDDLLPPVEPDVEVILLVVIHPARCRLLGSGRCATREDARGVGEEMGGDAFGLWPIACVSRGLTCVRRARDDDTTHRGAGRGPEVDGEGRERAGDGVTDEEDETANRRLSQDVRVKDGRVREALALWSLERLTFSAVCGRATCVSDVRGEWKRPITDLLRRRSRSPW